jgi:hypothetical protein
MTTIFLVAREREQRGELILSALEHGAPTDPHGDTAGVRLPLPPDQAHAELAERLSALDSDWPRFVAVL